MFYRLQEAFKSPLFALIHNEIVYYIASTDITKMSFLRHVGLTQEKTVLITGTLCTKLGSSSCSAYFKLFLYQKRAI